ncbi:MAG TPA: LamG domain-containing protein [Phycisphaerae bacterium]|nr:LamG domain-containing protein [Phycisphaerae bacterium]
MSIAWAAGTQAQNASASVHLDQANMAAESAGQLAVWHFKNTNTWRQANAPTQLPTITIGSGTYSYALTCNDAGAAATLYWPFDEGSGLTTADTSGHGNLGHLVGGVSWLTSGKYASALTFDGSTGYVDAGASASTNITGSVTVAAWIKLNTAGNDQKVGGNQDGVSGGYKMSIFGLRVEFEVRDATNTYWINRNAGVAPNPPGTILTMNTWYHVAGVYNAQAHTISTYVNGLPDRVPPDPACCNMPANALAPTTGDFIMGREPWVGSLGSTRYFDGSIDDVRVYNRALSAAEIRALADTSVHIHAIATRQGVTTGAASGAVDFTCSAPTPAAPLAPALTVGGNLPMKHTSVSGDVQATGSVTGVATSSVNGHLTYGTTYSDPSHYITVTLNGKTGSATQLTASPPTLNYTWIQGLKSLADGTAGTGKTYTFTPLYTGQVPLIYVNGNVTDPVIDTSQSGGTLLINGTLTLTKATTYGAIYPVNIICENNVTQTNAAAKLTLTGSLYVKGNWTHYDSTISGDVCVTGNVTDNSVNGSSFTVGGIPWFDPRNSAAPVPQPVYYTDYEGVAP